MAGIIRLDTHGGIPIRCTSPMSSRAPCSPMRLRAPMQPHAPPCAHAVPCSLVRPCSSIQPHAASRLHTPRQARSRALRRCQCGAPPWLHRATSVSHNWRHSCMHGRMGVESVCVSHSQLGSQLHAMHQSCMGARGLSCMACVPR